MLGFLLADECMCICRHVAKAQPRSIRLTCQHRCVSPESSSVTLFTATTRGGRVSALCPSLSQFPLCLSLCILPLPFSASVFFFFCSPVRHFDAPVVPPALHAPRVQLALQTPCSQRTMHNPAPVMQTTQRYFHLH